MATKLMMVREDHKNHIVSIEHNGTEGVRGHPERGAFIVPGDKVIAVRCQECDYTFIEGRDYEVEPIPDWEASQLLEREDVMEDDDDDQPEPWQR